MLLVDDLAAGGTKNLCHTPRGLVTLTKRIQIFFFWGELIDKKHNYKCEFKDSIHRLHNSQISTL